MTPLLRYDLSLELCVAAPMLQSGLPLPWIGVDAAPLLGQDGTLIVSGDQIEGYLRAVMEANGAPAEDIAAWFGSEGGQIEHMRELGGQRARLKLFDLRGMTAPDEYRHYHRVRIDADTGATATGSFHVIAQPVPPRTTMTFSGQGRLFAEDDAEADRLCAWINAMFEILPAIGAVKSAGFGRLLSGTAERRGRTSLRPREQAAELTGRAVLLRFDEPLLVEPERRSGNLYDGGDVIPGAVLKGAIADMLDLAGCREPFDPLLSALTIRHAFPAAAGAPRPFAAPLSLAFDGDQARDALAETETLPLRFRPDWRPKDEEAVACQFYLPDTLPRYARTRTAVKDNLPVEGRLFSQRMVATSGLIWHSALVLPPDADAALQADLGRLVVMLKETGIARIGKNAVPAQVEIRELAASDAMDDQENLRLTLQTPAWLTPSDWLLDANGVPRAVEARALYERYFEKVAPDATLIDFMARQQWAGGSRFIGARSERADCYYPWLLTSPGSLFLLRGVSRAQAQDWVRHGLPLPEARDWRNCPFVRENGFGEVRAGLTDLARIRQVRHVH